jgi:hypothetical protein
MINAQGALETARVWGIALLSTGIAGVLYALTGLAGRAAAPWTPRRSRTR